MGNVHTGGGGGAEGDAPPMHQPQPQPQPGHPQEPHARPLHRQGSGAAGGAPLHTAIAREDAEAAKQLIAKRSDLIHAQDKKGRTPLHVACHVKSEELVRLLVKRGCDLNALDSKLWTPLHTAARVKGNQPVLQVLLQQKGLRVDLRNEDRNTALHYLCRTYHAPDCKPLFDAVVGKGADVNAANKDGETPLHNAVWRNSPVMVSLLLKAGADPNKPNSQGETPVHWAATLGLDSMLALLVPGADVSLPNARGKLALDLALDNGSPQCVDILQEATRAQERDAWLRQWLGALGLARYVAAFQAEEFDSESILHLDDTVLRAMEIPTGVRLVILNDVKARLASRAAPESDHQSVMSSSSGSTTTTTITTGLMSAHHRSPSSSSPSSSSSSSSSSSTSNIMHLRTSTGGAEASYSMGSLGASSEDGSGSSGAPFNNTTSPSPQQQQQHHQQQYQQHRHPELLSSPYSGFLNKSLPQLPVDPSSAFARPGPFLPSTAYHSGANSVLSSPGSATSTTGTSTSTSTTGHQRARSMGSGLVSNPFATTPGSLSPRWSAPSSAATSSSPSSSPSQEAFHITSSSSTGSSGHRYRLPGADGDGGVGGGDLGFHNPFAPFPSSFLSLSTGASGGSGVNSSSSPSSSPPVVSSSSVPSTLSSSPASAIPAAILLSPSDHHPDFSDPEEEDDQTFNQRLGEALSAKGVPIIEPHRLQFKHVIGKGFFSEVRLASWNRVNVAVKTILFNKFRTKTNREIFSKEVAIISKLRHPNILQFLGVCFHGGAYSIVTEFMTRGTVYSLVRTGHLQQYPNAYYDIASDICRGMIYLHNMEPTPILHRDLTSKNVLLDEKLNAKVGDFGVSRELNPDYISKPVGALPYVAPEVYLQNSYSAKSDVYSFGVILWEMISQKDPNQGMKARDMAEKVAKHGYRPALPEPGEKVSLGWPEELYELLECCWAQDPDARPSFDEVLRIIEDLLLNESSGYVLETHNI